jgi:hypothetical protein
LIATLTKLNLSGLEQEWQQYQQQQQQQWQWRQQERSTPDSGILAATEAMMTTAKGQKEEERCSETMYIAIQGWVGSGAQSEGECIMRILCFLSQEIHDAPTSPLCPTQSNPPKGLCDTLSTFPALHHV